MGQISGHVHWGDGSPASGRKVSGMAAGDLGGMISAVTTDSKGYFCLRWNSSARVLAKVFVDGNAKVVDVRDGESRLDIPIS